MLPPTPSPSTSTPKTSTLKSITLKRKRSSFISPTDQTIVTLKAGPGATPFNVHMELLCNSSEYFRGAFKGSFREAKEGMTTVDTNVNTMQIFMGWLYAQKLENPEAESENKAWSLRKDQLLQLYVLGDRYMIPELRNEVMRHIQIKYNPKTGTSQMPISFVGRAFEQVPATSPLCRWLIQYFAHFWNPEQDKETDTAEYANLPHDFLLGVALACRKRFVRFQEQNIIKSSTAGTEFLGDACDFHDHDDEESRKLCMEEAIKLNNLIRKDMGLPRLLNDEPDRSRRCKNPTLSTCICSACRDHRRLMESRGK